MNTQELINDFREAIDEIKELRYPNKGSKNKIELRLEMLISNTLGEESKYIKMLNTTPFYPVNVARVSGVDYTRENTEAWEEGKKVWINILNTMIEEIETFGNSGNMLSRKSDNKSRTFTKIFIVHGHDGEMKHETARFIEKLDFAPIILKEQPNEGRTIIEKFEDYSDVDFAIVLFSPDDLGKAQQEDEFHHRPRQNVVFELGFFIGKLGRQNVVVLHKVIDDFEMLTDFQGVLFVPYQDGWELIVARELKAVGFDVDPSKLL